MGFGIGFGEILLILVVAIIVVGPQKIPEFARTLGKIMRNLRKATSDLTNTVTRELELTEKDKSHLPPSKATGAESTQVPTPQNPATSPAKDTQPNKPEEASPAK